MMEWHVYQRGLTEDESHMALIIKYDLITFCAGYAPHVDLSKPQPVEVEQE